MDFFAYTKTALLVGGTFLVSLLGGIDGSLKMLCILEVVDFGTAWILSAWFHNSPKTNTGGLSSEVGRSGLVKKFMLLVYVAIAGVLDSYLGTGFIRSSVIIFFSINELTSITENIGLMGVPVPGVIKNALDALREKVNG